MYPSQKIAGAPLSAAAVCAALFFFFARPGVGGEYAYTETAIIEGRTLNFVVDTGSTYMLLAPAELEAIRGKTLVSILSVPLASGESAAMRLYFIPEVTIRGCRVRGVDAYEMRVNNTTGVIGTQVLEQLAPYTFYGGGRWSFTCPN